MGGKVDRPFDQAFFRIDGRKGRKIRAQDRVSRSDLKLRAYAATSKPAGRRMNGGPYASPAGVAAMEYGLIAASAFKSGERIQSARLVP